MKIADLGASGDNPFEHYICGSRLLVILEGKAIDGNLRKKVKRDVLFFSFYNSLGENMGPIAVPYTVHLMCGRVRMGWVNNPVR